MTKRDPAYDNWPVQTDHEETTEYLGVVADRGTPMLYQPSDGAVLESEIDEDERQLVPLSETRQSLEEHDSLGSFIASVSEERGWETLSEFAEEHLTAHRDEREG